MELSTELGTSHGLGHLGRLPSQVRRHIYTHSGLPQQALLSLDARSLGLAIRPSVHVRRGFPRDVDETIDDINAHFKPLVNLMLTCRALYDEVSTLLYAENKFVVQDHRSLRTLRPSTLGHLTQLCVLLHCTKGPPRALSRRYHYPGHDLPLDPSSTEGQAVLAEWEQTVRFLAAHVPPGLLDLELVCEIADHKYKPIPGHADLVGQALRDLPPLAAFHLRLGAWRNNKLSSEARPLATKHLAVKPDPTPFRFMDLPQELRLHILQYTTLVAPSRRVTWDLAQGYRLWSEVSSGDHVFTYSKGPLNPLCRAESGNGCFCPRVHAAWTPRCGCWTDPAALFLVSRQMTEDARIVFCGSNFIEVTTRVPKEPQIVLNVNFINVTTRMPEEEVRGYTATVYFRRVLQTVRHLRALKITSFFCNDEEGGEAASVEGWRRVRDELVRKGELDLRELTIRSYRQDLPTCDTLKTGTSESNFAAVRGVIHRYIWPLDRDGIRPFGTRKLLVEMRKDEFELQYVAEEVGEAGSVEGSCWVKERWAGPIAAARVTDGWCEKLYVWEDSYPGA